MATPFNRQEPFAQETDHRMSVSLPTGSPTMRLHIKSSLQGCRSQACAIMHRKNHKKTAAENMTKMQNRCALERYLRAPHVVRWCCWGHYWGTGGLSSARLRGSFRGRGLNRVFGWPSRCVWAVGHRQEKEDSTGIPPPRAVRCGGAEGASPKSNPFWGPPWDLRHRKQRNYGSSGLAVLLKRPLPVAKSFPFGT